MDFTRYVFLEDISDGIAYLLNFSNKDELKIGRGHDCDLKISEITISRQHFCLTMS